MFFFQSMFQQVYDGITASTTLSSVQSIAEGILLLAALFGVYEAWARGADVRALALAGCRYLLMGLILSQYPNVFRNVNNAFNGVAAMIAPTDVWSNFKDQVQGYLSSDAGQGAWWNWVIGGVSGAFSLIFQAWAVLVFPISYTIFSFFYAMYGAILYVCGPLVLALYPALGVGQLARAYMVNLLIWNAWGIIYAIISQLLSIMSADSLSNILTAQNFGGAFQGASQMLMISLSSILLSIMILLIPFLAKRIVSGDVGSTLFAVISAAGAAVQTTVVGFAGFMSGLGGRGPDDPGGGGGGGGAGGVSRAPRPLDQPTDGGTNNEGFGTGGEETAASRAPQGPDDGQTGSSSGGDARVEPSATLASGGGDGAEPPTGGSTHSANQYRPRILGLQHIVWGLGTAAGDAARGIFGPRNSG